MINLKSLFLLSFILASALSSLRAQNYIGIQTTNARLAPLLKTGEDTLRKQFEAKGLKWPAKYIYMRSFKYEKELEVWVKNDIRDTFQVFKVYKICHTSGKMGPKRKQGDMQVPEGFYYISEFNPNSNYHLALGLDYPNISDRLKSGSSDPGGDIYIHGSCVSVGCIPILDNQIEEVYMLAAISKQEGQDYIPVHIYPIRYNLANSATFLKNQIRDDKDWARFNVGLESSFNYFQQYHRLPVVAVNSRGDYVIR
jgi:murein L,D-transpeptidase YafK